MTNEKRLIDANKLKTKAIADPDSGEGIVYVQDIDESPTVDAVEVVHGHTLIAEQPKKVLLDRKCEICDQLMLATDNYCPMCGAKNEGEMI